MRLVWFRNDLRLADNPALAAACAAPPVTAVVCLTPRQWARHNVSPTRMAYWHDRLAWLEGELAMCSIPLVRLRLQRFRDCPNALLELCRTLQVDELHLNYEYPLDERRRDHAVGQALRAGGVRMHGHHGDLILPPGSVLTGNGGPFKVFTPFSRAWRRRLLQTNHAPVAAPPAAGKRITSSVTLSGCAGDAGLYDRNLWPVEQERLLTRLERFLREQEPDYAQRRDYPALNGTSALSPALSIGALSARQCLAALQAERGDDSWLESRWLGELIWREFYRHLLVAFPGQSRLEPFKPEVEARISWQENETAFAAWKAGETGYPLVDAAMKQLSTTGWMHNRLRMIVANFLTKLLRIDWRRGEAFFMSRLIDADFASNLGGWSWSASVGADAAPYFRIFNPQLQSEKFDPEGSFIATWLPELASLPAQARHKPGAGQQLGRPAPIVDYTRARRAALEDYNGS
jgi:deoxyribodipyrimidine photo-lyase